MSQLCHFSSEQLTSEVVSGVLIFSHFLPSGVVPQLRYQFSDGALQTESEESLQSAEGSMVLFYLQDYQQSKSVTFLMK